jgi:hypothetical protein
MNRTFDLNYVRLFSSRHRMKIMQDGRREKSARDKFKLGTESRR